MGNSENKTILLDTETTGLTGRDELIEISLLLVQFDRRGRLEIVDEYAGLREPEVSINPQAHRVHNIDFEQVKGEKLDRKKIKKLLNRTDFLVAHNASFDRRFVCNEIELFRQKRWLCSMRGINWGKFGCSSRGLENLLHFHGIKISQSHRAAMDTRALLRLLNCRPEGISTYFLRLLKNSGIEPEKFEYN